MLKFTTWSKRNVQSITDTISTIHSSFKILSLVTDEGRRETWNETVGRYFNFFEEHLEEMHNFKLDNKTRTELEEGVLDTSVMPSKRGV